MSSSSDVSFHTAEEGSHSRGVPARRARGVTQPRNYTVRQRGRRSAQGRGSLVPWSFNVQGHSVSVLPLFLMLLLTSFLQECRGLSDPYPTAQQANEWSSSFEPENDLGDLHMTDYLAASSRISRRHIRQMVMHPYQRGLLMRGLQRYSVDELVSEGTWLAMEYTGSVGTMVTWETAELSDRVERIV